MSAAVHDVDGSTKNLIYFYASGCVTGFCFRRGPPRWPSGLMLCNLIARRCCSCLTASGLGYPWQDCVPPAINAHSGNLNQPHTFDEILQVKAKLGK